MTAKDSVREGRIRQYARNVVSGGGRYGVGAVLALIVTPFAVSVLGNDRFGVWALAGAVLAMLRLLDLGLNRSLTRALADAHGRSDLTSSAAMLATARGLALILAGGIAIVTWLLTRPLVLGVFRVPPGLEDEAAYVVTGTALVAALEMVFSPYQGGLDGVGRMDVSNAIDTLQRVLSAVGVVLVLSLGWGLPGLVWKNLATAAIAGLAYRQALAKLSPPLVNAGLALDVALARRLLAYGRHIQVVNLGAMLIEPVSKVLLSRSLGLDAVAMFELASRIVGQVGGAFLALGAALFPAAACERSLSDRGDEAVRALYVSAARYLAWIALPCYALLLALAGPFVVAWLGQGYDAVALGIAVLGAGWLPAVLSTPAFVMAQAAGYERLATVASLVTVGFSLLGVVALVGPLGVTGVYLGIASGFTLGGLAILAGFARAYELGRQVGAGIGLREVLSVLVAAGIARATAATLAEGFPALVVAGIAGLVSYGALLVVLKVTGRGDYDRLMWLLGLSSGSRLEAGR